MTIYRQNREDMCLDFLKTEVFMKKRLSRRSTLSQPSSKETKLFESNQPWDACYFQDKASFTLIIVIAVSREVEDKGMLVQNLNLYF